MGLTAAVLATLAGCTSGPTPSPAAEQPATAPPHDQGTAAAGPAARAITPSLAITLADSLVSGRLAGEEDADWVRATLLAPDGQVRAAGEGRVEGADRVWTIYLRDPANDDLDVLVRPGDRLRVELDDGQGSGERTVVVPDLRLSFDRTAGVLSGWISYEAPGVPAPGPAALITATLQPAVQPVAGGGDPSPGGASPTQAPPTSLATRTDHRSAFSLDFGAVQLRGGDALGVTATLPDQRLTVSTARRVPYVRASLHPGDVTGAMRPDAEVEIELRDASGALRASGRSTSDSSGRFSGWALLPDGRRARPEPGDRVVVRDPEGEIRIDIPPFSAEADVSAGRFSGLAAPGAPVDVVLWNPWHPGELANTAAEADADGHWSIEPPVGLHPASHYYVTVHLSDGDLLYYCYQIPMLQVEPGSPAVEVQTLWEARTELELIRDGRVIARAHGGGPWSGNLRLVLRAIGGDRVGAPVVVEAGDVIRADFGTGEPVQVTVLPLEVEGDARSGSDRGAPPDRIRGRTAPGARIGLARSEAPITSTLVTAGPDGSFVLDAGPLAASADRAFGQESFEVFTTTDSGHNMRHRFVAPTLTVDLGGRGATGRAQPGARVTVFHRQAGGPPIATAETLADPTGAFTATFAEDAPPLGAGEVVGLRIGDEGSPETQMRLEAITAELDPGRALLRGTGPADGLLDVAVYVGAGEAPDRLSSFIGDDGAWSVDLRNPVSGLSALDLGQLRRIELVLRDEASGYAQRLVVTP